MTLAAVVNEGKANADVGSSGSRRSSCAAARTSTTTPRTAPCNLTLAGVLAKSSNIGTILAAERIGGKKLY